MLRHTLLASAAVLALGIGTASAERVHHMSGQTASANVRTTGMQTRSSTFGQTQYSGRQGMALSTDRQTFSTGNRIRGERFEHRRFTSEKRRCVWGLRRAIVRSALPLVQGSRHPLLVRR